MKVFITPVNGRLGDWWIEKGSATFTLHAPDAADGTSFDFRIVAKRKGYEDIRLEPAPSAYTDHFLYPDIEDVPEEYRFEWVRITPYEERDPAWLQYLTEDQRYLLEEAEHGTEESLEVNRRIREEKRKNRPDVSPLYPEL